MRLFVVLLMAVTVVFAVVPTSSFAATVTKEQVVNVCGKKLTSSGDNSGCTVGCGGGKKLCDYECKKDKCTGTVMMTVGPSLSPRGRLVSIQVKVEDSDLHGACDIAGGLFTAGGHSYQCVAINGDILTCDAQTHTCTGQVADRIRPPTLFGFATAPFEPPSASSTGNSLSTFSGGAEPAHVP